VRDRIYMKTTKRIVLATIAMAIFAAVMVGATWAKAEQQPTTDSATSAETQAAAATTATTPEGSSASSRKSSYTIEVSGSKQWMDTNIDLRRGEKLRITADGTITYAKGNHFGPAGIPRSFADVIHEYAVPNGGARRVDRAVGIGRCGGGV
jgi:hypothetical protein